VSEKHEREVGDWVSRAFFSSLGNTQTAFGVLPSNARLSERMPSIFCHATTASAKTALIDDDNLGRY
jgi:hypothetical protein